MQSPPTRRLSERACIRFADVIGWVTAEIGEAKFRRIVVRPNRKAYDYNTSSVGETSRHFVIVGSLLQNTFSFDFRYDWHA